MAKKMAARERELAAMNKFLEQRPRKCGDDVCGMLSLSLNMSDSRRGNVAQLVIDLKTGKTRRNVTYFGGDFKSGIRINFCPFCGKKPPVMKD